MVRGKKHIHVTSGTWSRKIFTKMHKKKPIKKNYKLDYIKSNNFVIKSSIKSLQIHWTECEKVMF